LAQRTKLGKGILDFFLCNILFANDHLYLLVKTVKKETGRSLLLLAAEVDGTYGTYQHFSPACLLSTPPFPKNANYPQSKPCKRCPPRSL
jgi:hypothetical protein